MGNRPVKRPKHMRTERKTESGRGARKNMTEGGLKWALPRWRAKYSVLGKQWQICRCQVVVFLFYFILFFYVFISKIYQSYKPLALPNNNNNNNNNILASTGHGFGHTLDLLLPRSISPHPHARSPQQPHSGPHDRPMFAYLFVCLSVCNSEQGSKGHGLHWALDTLNRESDGGKPTTAT
ncbi:uncharacterized protein LY79DRAFT_63432 [Colletotrichum navitas]|uniref:Uncharacterized protein n=1 Tax=Colletotrichum navitas TaxID=681940 RepID=A0AAD8Q5Q9_9PEZI|nr:uncharacterized protein LY79DRAFT_63432 [Colletotrichum navitas]KAK1596400.1 hypothetical protein LY79DRAFT_63432 [Colletotrichum navitas]